MAPGDAKALACKAYAQFDAGAPSAGLFAKARDSDPRNPDLVLKHAAALHAEGHSDEGERLLDAVTAANPHWVEAHRTLAQLRWEAQTGPDPLASFVRAEAGGALPAEVWVEHARLAERFADSQAADAIIARASEAMGPNLQIDLIAAQIACEADDFAGREAEIAKIRDRHDPAAALTLCRWLGRMHRFDELCERSEALWKRGFGRDVLPYVALGWRGIDDPRWEWLERGGGFVRAMDLAGEIDDLEALAARLRSLHRTKHHPLEQSLRGGTQTDGMLFANSSPEIRQLRDVIEAAIAHYLAELPKADRKHPLLSLPRDHHRFAGAWSVRLAGGGFHVQHFHQAGDLSSACYIALPDGLGAGAGSDGAAAHAGWLSVGEPPAEFGLDWEPLKLIEPREGLLALFPSWSWHGTRPFAAGERLTVAFDVALG
ncbi:putative 2OG-Fe(II) oxygenase [Qipengyuania marisflavi]